MAIITTNSKFRPVFGFFTWIHKMETRINNHMMYKKTLNELRSLSDRELNDININRSDLMRIAKQSSYR